MTNESARRTRVRSTGAPIHERDLLLHADREARRLRLDAFLASRDAGYSITSDALDAGIDLHAIVAAASKVAAFADEALGIVLDEYRPALACREGCSYCCCKPGVLVTIPELLRIREAIESRFDDVEKSAIAARARRYAEQIDGKSFNDPTNDSVPCPLLANGRCTVYDVRPLVCRGYNSTSAEACRSAHDDVQQRVPIFSVLKDVTDGASVGVSQSLRDAGLNDAMVDLGGSLHIMLRSDEDLGHVLLSAESSAFASVEHSTWAVELWHSVKLTARNLEA